MNRPCSLYQLPTHMILVQYVFKRFNLRLVNFGYFQWQINKQFLLFFEFKRLSLNLIFTDVNQSFGNTHNSLTELQKSVFLSIFSQIGILRLTGIWCWTRKKLKTRWRHKTNACSHRFSPCRCVDLELGILAVATLFSWCQRRRYIIIIRGRRRAVGLTAERSHIIISPTKHHAAHLL